MHLVFCADRKALPGLHVAAYSMLDRFRGDQAAIHLFSDDFDAADLARLRQTLTATGKAFTLTQHTVDPARFSSLPPLNGGWTTYYRLFAAQELDVERFLYLDADLIVDLDVSPLDTVDFQGAPARWVPEANLSHAADRKVAEQLGGSADVPYFNAGVMLINVAAWRRQRITEQALAYMAEHEPAYWDQSGLNFVLHGKTVPLDGRYNYIANMRKHWPALRRPYGQIERIVHFLDYPKPWDFFGEWIHPQATLFCSVLARTALRDFRSWQNTPSRRLPKTATARGGYQKAIKDRFLFALYCRGLLKRVKGMPDEPDVLGARS